MTAIKIIEKKTKKIVAEMAVVYEYTLFMACLYPLFQDLNNDFIGGCSCQPGQTA